MKPTSPDEVAAFLIRYRHDPIGFCKVMFPWGEGLLKNFDGPLDWQLDVLREAGTVTYKKPVTYAVASGHGVGKSALTAMLALWMLATYPDTMGIITANTETQLKTKTFAEVARWFNRSPLTELFTMTGTSIMAKDPAHSKFWRLDIVPWSERNSEAFAGLHNNGKRQFMIFDEASAIPDLIFEVASGFMTDSDTERLWFLFGNPTRNTGYFRECFPPDGRFQSLWTTKNIDSRDVPISDKGWIKDRIAQYGEDSDYVRVRIRGQFPLGNSMEFISREIVRKAMSRPDPHGDEPVVMGVDVARAGINDTVVFVRKGLNGRRGLFRWNGATVTDTADRVGRLIDRFQPNVVTVDAGGVGGGVVDLLVRMGYPVVGVQFGSKPSGMLNGVRPLNRRAEMWWEMREWLRNGGALPQDDRLADELCSVCEKVAKTERLADYFILESKGEMEARGAPSPDAADALALTFAIPVARKARKTVAGRAKTDYNPLGSSLEQALQSI